MILHQLLRIVDAEESGAEELCQLTDQFRESRDAAELIEALDSESDEFVRLAVYILKEIPAERYSDRRFITRLAELTTHDDPAIRFLALGAIFPLLEADGKETREMVCRLCVDENEGVRMAAQAAAERLGISKRSHSG